MKLTTIVLSISIAASPALLLAQTPSATPTALAAILSQVEQAAQQTNLDLANLRIEKWKTDGDTKRQSQVNADSLMNNLSAALPTMISAARSSPEMLAPALKLYRDVNVLYDVLGGMAESAGAFGPKDDYNALAADEHAFDQARRALGDYVENLATIKDAQLARMAALPTANQAKSNVPKKVVDDEEPVKKPRKKKKPATAATTAPSNQ